MNMRNLPRSALSYAHRVGDEVARRARTEADRITSRGDRADLAVFHEFLPPPTGGGSQFLRALVRELEGRGLVVELNRISGQTPACLFNSFNFDFARLRRFARHGRRMVHRVDGPIGVYRGFDDGTDRRILEINHELASVTIVQSRFSLEQHQALGLGLREPAVIPNAVDATIFHPPETREPLAGRRVRLVATSWSDNPNKGAEIFSWLDRNLDWKRYELTFVGRSAVEFEHIRMVGPVGSSEVAERLREADLYLAASRNDPCSNALLEALTCGLPAAYMASGGHPELVGSGGLPFSAPEELPAILDRLTVELDERRSAISIPSLADVTDRYLEVLGVEAASVTA
jgi:glycosyltransferase involved in cell wall biosynthesis